MLFRSHLSYIKPHWPYIAPRPYADMFGPEDMLPAVRHERERGSHPVYDAFQHMQIGESFSRDETRETVIPTYMGLVKQIDDHLGRLFAYLETSGRMRDTAIIFTSRNAVDHFFHICKELKIEMPPEMKYFCISDQTANYLQKYIVIRKRKIFAGLKSTQDLLDLIRKHKNEKYLFACSDIRKNDIPDYLKSHNIQYSEAIIHRTVAADLSDLKDVFYDILAFFSPSGINSLFVNFPEFKQNNTRIATFGPATAQAGRDAGLILDIEAPLPNAPSMTGAIELYIRKANGVK